MAIVVALSQRSLMVSLSKVDATFLGAFQLSYLGRLILASLGFSEKMGWLSRSKHSVFPS